MEWLWVLNDVNGYLWVVDNVGIKDIHGYLGYMICEWILVFRIDKQYSSASGFQRREPALPPRRCGV